MQWTAYWILLGIGIVATGVFLYLRVTRGGISALYAKAAASLCFISTAVAATNTNKDFTVFGSCITFGLIFGMLGDIWLDLKWIYLQDKSSYLYSGFISFLFGHLSFNAAIYIFSDYKATPAAVAVSIIVSLLIAVGNLLLEKPMKYNFGQFRFIVFLYTFFLALTMISAIVAAISTHFEKEWVVMAVGGILFTLSDAVLSGMYFGENKNTKFNIFLNHLLYYGAQFTMAATILCIK